MKTVLKAALFTIAALVTLAAIGVAGINVYGRRAWDGWVAERKALGESLDWSQIAPAPIPDERNMASAPIFAELFVSNRTGKARIDGIDLPSLQAGGSWREGRRVNLAAWRTALSNDNLAAALATYNPLLNEVREAAARPDCRYPLRYDEGYAAVLPHCSPLVRLGRFLKLRAIAGLEEGRTADAISDLRLLMRLEESLKAEPTLISVLIRTAMLDGAVQAVWEGIVDHRFTDPQLAELQALLAQPDLISHWALAFQGERRFAIGLLPELIKNPRGLLAATGMGPEPTTGINAMSAIPRGWFYLNIRNLDRFYVEKIIPAVDAPRGIIHPDVCEKAESALADMRRSPMHVLAQMVAPAVAAAVRRPAAVQAGLRQAILACAIERHRLAAGTLPEGLQALVPAYLTAVPADPVGGAPLRFRPDGTGYVLYSVGWDERDGGGLIARKSDDQTADDRKADWVWFSAPK